MTIWDLLARLFGSWRGVVFVVVGTLIALAGMGYVAHTVAEPGTNVSLLNLVTYTKARSSVPSATVLTAGAPRGKSASTAPVEHPAKPIVTEVIKEEPAVAPDVTYAFAKTEFESIELCVNTSREVLLHISGAKLYFLKDGDRDVGADVGPIYVRSVCARPASAVVLVAFRPSDGRRAVALMRKVRDEIDAAAP